MRKTLSFFLCAVWACYCSATSVSFSEKTIAAEEAEKLGFKKVLVPKISKLPKKSGIEIISIANINEAIEITIKSG